MTQLAHVFLRRGRDQIVTDIGEKEVYPIPALRGTVRFVLQGKVETGIVEQIDPPGWSSRPHGTPTIHVVLSQPAWSPKRKAPPGRGLVFDKEATER